MLDTGVPVSETDLGIGLQFSCQVGNGRNIVLTAGFPLAWDAKQINQLLDKLADVAGRQAQRYELHDREAAIANMYHQIEVQQTQQARYTMELRSSWDSRGKRGDFSLSSDQKSKLATYETSIEGLRAAILKAEHELEELKQKCR